MTMETLVMTNTNGVRLHIEAKATFSGYIICRVCFNRRKGQKALIKGESYYSCSYCFSFKNELSYSENVKTIFEEAEKLNILIVPNEEAEPRFYSKELLMIYSK